MPRKLIVRSAYEKKGAMQFNLSTAAFLFCLDAALKSVCKASGAGVKFERALGYPHFIRIHCCCYLFCYLAGGKQYPSSMRDVSRSMDWH
jgi:hypothetical protein